jgi:hypothetical protein
MFLHKMHPNDVAELDRIKRLIVDTAKRERPDLLKTPDGQHNAISMDEDCGVEWLLFRQVGDDLPPGNWHPAVFWMRERFPDETSKGGDLSHKAHKVRCRI